MRLIQTKISFSILVLVLLVSPQACLVEQVLAEVKEVVPHGHAEKETDAHHSAAPSHKHDEAEHEDQFCCDNNFNLYLPSYGFVQLEVDRQIDFIPAEIANFDDQLTPFQPNYHLCYLKKPPTPRGRDKYALSCLLHAPPRF